MGPTRFPSPERARANRLERVKPELADVAGRQRKHDVLAIRRDRHGRRDIDDLREDRALGKLYLESEHRCRQRWDLGARASELDAQ